jgi:hypothetical protein
MRLAVILVPASLALATAAHADVVISTAATANMSCSGGVCAPTAKNAVLNVGDLENLLASGNVEVTTTGSGSQADSIEVDAPLTWSSSSTLILNAHQSILVKRLVSVAGQGGLSIATSDGGKSGYFGFQNKGQATFANLSSALTINGTPYTLVGDIATLAADIAGNSAGNYALASDYNAENDGAYSNSPIPTEFGGAFEGLGNTISNLALIGTGNLNDPVGLFAELAVSNEPGGSIENINLQKLSVSGSSLDVGGLVGVNEGIIGGSFVSGTLTATFQQGAPGIGGITGFNLGTITRSGAKATLSSDQAETQIGGLAGESGGSISQSFAQCKVSAGDGTYLGELVGDNIGPITESYAGGSITGGEDSEIGGLVGDNAEESTISQSYSTIALKGVSHRDRDAGGLIGIDDSPPHSNASDYWDMTTSHMSGRSDGAGTPRNDPGIQGRSTQQLQSGLPKGFDKKVWAEDPKINKGFPYLIANPPRKD